MKAQNIAQKGNAMKTRDIVQVGMFAAIIYLGVLFFKIPVGEQMVHIGNALVVVGLLVFGWKKGTLSAVIGLGLFDILNGWASSAPATIIEALIVCLLVYFIFEVLMKKNDKISNIIIVAIIAAIAKIIMNAFKYTVIRGMIVSGLAFYPALSIAMPKIVGTYGSSTVTAITVPLLYPIVKRIVKSIS